MLDPCTHSGTREPNIDLGLPRQRAMPASLGLGLITATGPSARRLRLKQTDVQRFRSRARTKDDAAERQKDVERSVVLYLSETPFRLTMMRGCIGRDGGDSGGVGPVPLCL
jgi:hypothetical protein